MGTFNRPLAGRLPPLREAWPVFSIAVFGVYSWALFRMFYEVPSWLYYLSLVKILVLVAYTLAFALVESLAVFAFAVLVGILLPVRIYSQRFIPQGSLTVGLICLAAVTVQRRLGALYTLQTWQLAVYPLAFAVLLVLLALLFGRVFDRFTRVQVVLQKIGEWMSVFGYLYFPASLLALLVVLVRNLR